MKKNRINEADMITDISLYKLDDKSEFRYIEAYNHLRTNIMFSLAALGSQKKAIVVSSSYPSEGKSTLSSNLAISLAKLQYKILIIDADMRKPKLHRIFGVQNKYGLSNVLLNSAVDNSIVGISGLNLDFMPAGTVPPNPSELLGSTVAAELIGELEKIYDYIIIDTPPVLVVSDALTLSGSAAGMLISCRYGKTSYNDISKVLVALETAKFPVLGTVIMGAKGLSEHGYFGSRKKYGYSYEYGQRS